MNLRGPPSEMQKTPLEHEGIKYDDILRKSSSKVQDKLDTLKANGKDTTEKLAEKVKNDQNESHIPTQLFT